MPRLAAESAKTALGNCAMGLVPSLFPFIAVVGIINSSGFSEILAKVFGKPVEFIFGVKRECISAIILGALGGFPIGAVCARELYLKGALTRDEAERLLSFTNNASPAFCIGTVGIAFFNSASFGIKLYVFQLVSAIIIGISGRKKTSEKRRQIYSRKPPKISELITKSVTDSGFTMLKICSFAVFFAIVGDVVCAVFEHHFGITVCTAVVSLFELTLAARRCVELGSIGRLLCSFAVGFSGLSVHMQVASVVSDCPVSMTKYYLAKLIQGFMCMGFMLISNQMSSLLFS